MTNVYDRDGNLVDTLPEWLPIESRWNPIPATYIYYDFGAGRWRTVIQLLPQWAGVIWPETKSLDKN